MSISEWRRETPFVAWLPTMASLAMWTTPPQPPVMMAVFSTTPRLVREPARHLNKKAPVDLPDHLQVAGEQLADQVLGPRLQRLGQHRMVRVAEGARCDGPGVIPYSRPSSSTNLRISSGIAIEGCVSLSWMATFCGSLPRRVVRFFISADDVSQRGRYEEILLLQAQLLSRHRGNRSGRGPSICSRCYSCPQRPLRSRRC